MRRGRFQRDGRARMNFLPGNTVERGDALGVSTPARPYRFALVGIVKNEARYILEWLAFHHATGVEHFVVFDNESTDDTREILNAYAGLVDIDVIDWPLRANESPQITAYNEFLRRYKHKFEFAAFLDADEFLVPCEGTVLRDFLEEIPDNVGAIGFNQRVFGSGGEVYYKPDLLIKRFRRCAARDYHENRYVKSMYRLSDIETIGNVHTNPLARGCYAFADFTPLSRSEEAPGTATAINPARFQLNHYILKSRAEFEHKRHRGSGTATSDAARQARYTDGFFTGREPGLNTTISDAADAWVPKVLEKIRMFQSHCARLGLKDFARKYYADALSSAMAGQGGIKIIQFDSADKSELDRLHLSFAAVSRLFLGPADAPEPAVPGASPAWASFYVKREFRACEDNFLNLRHEVETAPHPATGVPVGLEYCFVPKILSFMTLPVFKVYGQGESRFCLVFAGLLNRVTHIILPELRCVLYDIDRATAQSLWDAFRDHMPPVAPQARRRIGLLDMVTSYAHQAMNYLSGLQRLLDSGLDDCLDEIWVCGVEFFGRTEEVFPEFADKIHRPGQREAAGRLSGGGYYVCKLGSNFVSEALNGRLMNIAAGKRRVMALGKKRWPLLAVTVRSAGKCCINLPDVVENIVHGLLPDYPDLGLILDGWVFPETAIIAESSLVTALTGPCFSRIREEAQLCQAISSRLPPGVLVHNLVGLSLGESLQVVRDADVYFAHAGTLQHKIAWFSGAPGIVHGPRPELSRMESSYYASESAQPPVFVDIEQIVDVSDGTPGEPRFHDYFILDSSGIVRTLKDLISRRNQSA